MWLLEAKSRKLTSVLDEREHPYAILSHTWGEEEVTFQDLQSDPTGAEKRAGYEKILFTCQQALDDGLRYAWVDTCCIDKRSSAELSEAINSMYSWYQQAKICYAYLSDAMEGRESLPSCRWFQRGWTLQELLAPGEIEFYGPKWRPMGTRTNLVDVISKITRIEPPALMKSRPLDTFTIATRMSWAAGRDTARLEDRAYSLLGIFDVNMPLIYGEGKKAFQRLQAEIINSSNDLSILVWEADRLRHGDLLAQSPDDFRKSTDVVHWDEPGPPLMFELTKSGLQIQLPILKHPDVDHWAMGVLQCRHRNSITGPLVLLLDTVGESDTLGSSAYHSSESAKVFRVDRSLELFNFYHMFNDPGIRHLTLRGSSIPGTPEDTFLGLVHVPLEKVKLAESRSITLVRRHNTYPIPLLPQHPSSFGKSRWARVWVWAEDLAHDSYPIVSRACPNFQWRGPSIFETANNEGKVGGKVWLHDRPSSGTTTPQHFILGFRVCPGLPEIGEYPEGLHMILIQSEKVLDGLRLDTGGSTRDDRSVDILNSLLEKTTPCTAISARFENFRDVSVVVKFTERMGEPTYSIHVTMTEPRYVLPNRKPNPWPL